jgi:hypothetical protein
MWKNGTIIVVSFLVLAISMNSTFAQETTPATQSPSDKKPEVAKDTAAPATAPVATKQEEAKDSAPTATAPATPKTEQVQGTTSTAPAPVATNPEPVNPVFTNTEIIKLAGLGMGSDVIIAKINAAKQVSFKVETDDLVALKNAGVGQDVITAMVKRSASPVAEQGRGAAGGATHSPMGARAAHGMGDRTVQLVTKDKKIDLISIAGNMSSTWAYWTTLFFMDYPNLKAEVRIKDRKPYILVESSKSPQGRIFLVICDPDTDDNNRSVKIGKSGAFSVGGFSAPDSDDDWTVPVEVKAVEDGLWRIDPKKDLKPGEYGVWADGGELYDFGVDK